VVPLGWPKVLVLVSADAPLLQQQLLLLLLLFALQQRLVE
jgi:hypothetical protein